MATNDTTPTPAEDGTAASTPAPAPAASTAAPRRGAGRALAITGIAVGSVLTLGLTFAGGVALGQVLPGGPGDRGDRIGERIEQRMDERMEQRQEQRDELRAQFEQWLQDQGIDPSELPAPPAP